MSEATHEQVNLMLKLYDLRREAKLREARDWFGANFHVKNMDEFTKLCPPGSQPNTYFRMVIGYWEMVAGIVNRGLIDEEMFFESSGEQWAVWQQVKAVVPGWREMFGSKHVLGNLEKHVGRLEAWREKRDPGVNEKMNKFFEQMQQLAAKTHAAAN